MESKRVKTPNSGRKAGTPNKVNSDTKALLQKIIGKELEKLGNLLEGLEPIERVNAISKLLPYILPRQIESTLKGDKETPLVITNSDDREKRIAELIAKAQLK